MNKPIQDNMRRLGWRLLPLLGLVLLLAACGSYLDPAATPSNRFDLITTITIDPTTTRAEVQAEYDGTIVVFRPEAGFAILGMSEQAVDASSELTTARRKKSTTATSSAISVESNTSTFVMPEAFASGFTSWSGGFTSWSGGFTSWSGGFTSWSGGFTSWSGGSPEPTSFAENLGIWDQINLPEGQQLAPNLGSGVKVAVIDTGIDLTHPAFSGNLAPASEWRDFVDNDSYPMDEAGGIGYGHGTAVAGIVMQVVPNVTILPIRVLDADGVGDSTNVVAAVDWAIAHGAQVINLSLGSNVEVQAFKDMLHYASEQNVSVVASAGNTGDQNITSPACYSEQRGTTGRVAIGVGSVDSNDIKSTFSTYGTNLEMVAPGEFVTTLVPGSQVGHWSGTSFSAPMVSGALALALAEYPRGKQAGLVDDLIDSLASIDDVNDPSYDNLLGVGRLDAEAFLTMTHLRHELKGAK